MVSSRRPAIWHEPVDTVQGRPLLSRVNTRAAHAIETYIGVAQQRKHERVLDADAVREQALHHWNHCTAYDSHDQKTRALAGQWPQAFDPQREDGRKHDRVEKADRD